jgi:hypothetical protein
MPSDFKFQKILLPSLLFLGFAMIPRFVLSQTFPMSVSANLTPPYSTQYSEYFQPGANKFMITLNFNDFNEPSFDVRLRIKIEGPSITMQTKSTFLPSSPVTITPGVPIILTGSDLSEYFAFNSWDYSGISQQNFQQNGSFIEGQYQFCVEVLDYLTGKEISQQNCASAWIQLKDQPLVIAPTCGDPVIPGLATNIVFQWQNSGSLSANSVLSTEYELEIFEVTVPSANPMTASANNQVLSIFKSGFQSSTTYIYGPGDPTLDLGRKYVWRVQARDQNGFDTFKNQGYTEVCWFSYGYPEGGVIALNEPESEMFFTKADLPYFKWSTPDNLLSGQQIEYTLKIVEINNGQDPETALSNNLPWLEETTAPTSAPNGFEYLAQDSIPKMKGFAWQVSAKTGEQTIAESDVFTFTGPPLVEEFKAGEHKVLVSKLESSNLSDLDGVGFIQIGDTAEVEVEFEGLELTLVGGNYVLNSGVILYDLIDMGNISLKAQSENNPDGIFIPEQIKLDKNQLQIKGLIELPLPLATNGSDQPVFKTSSDWLNFDEFTLAGTQKSDEDNNGYSLLDPFGFSIIYTENAEIIINNNEFVLDLEGIITLPQSVISPDGNAVDFEFSEQDNFQYGIINGISDSEFKVVTGSRLFLSPTKAILDFSGDESPGILSGDDSWTGVYFTEGALTFPAAIDESGQVTLAAEQDFDAALSQPYLTLASVSGAGIQFEAAFNSSNEIYAAVNGYKGIVKALNLKVEDGETTAGEFKIDAVLPFINSSKLFEIVVPHETDHYDKAFFPVSITESIVFDEEDDQRKTTISVKNVLFDDNGELDMSVDISNSYTGLSITNLQSFKVDASGQVGFNEVGLPLALEGTASANMGGIPLDVDSIMLGKVGGNYGVAIGASMNLGIMTSGKDGELRTTLVSALNYVAPEASGGASADVAANFDATTMSASASASGEAGASGSGGGVSGGAQAGGSGGASIGNGQVSASGDLGASADLELGLANKLLKGVNLFTGGTLKDDHEYEVEIGAGAGASAGTTEHGFKAECDAHLDIVIASASGHLLFEVDERWGAVMRGGASLSGKFIKIKYIEDIDGELALGVKDGKTLALMRAQATTAIPVFPPKLGLTHIGFAAGLHFAPETFSPDDFTPATTMDYDIDMSVPLFAYVSAGISDFVPSMEGIVYRLQTSGGLRAEGEVDLNNPASLTDLQLCGSMNVGGGLINIGSGFLANIFADKSAISLEASSDVCVGKLYTQKGRGQAKFMITPAIHPLPGIPICGEAPITFDSRINFGAVTDPSKFIDDFLYSYKFGSEQDPVNVQFFCDPSMKLAKGWFGLTIQNSSVEIDLGVGVEINKSIAFPNIPTGFASDYVAPYFTLNAEIVAKTNAMVGLGSLKNPAPEAAFALNVNASIYSTAGVKYKLLGQTGDLKLGTIYLSANGVLEASTSGELLLAGDFEADVSVMSTTYQVQHSGSIAIPIK